ncbi:MAG: glutamate synthase subunit beta [SAR202 cluster bacterium]|nr:glutamate synthase subunit beta [SAR202 cluster bacterium]
MGKPTGFIELKKVPLPKRPVKERVGDYKEFLKDWDEKTAREQGARCMNCSVPFCHKGCPLGNLIPDWNDLVYRGRWEQALTALHATNNFPEFTGRVCPAPCEASCVLAINQDPVTIEYIEKSIADRGWKEGWIKPEPPTSRTGKKVAVVGSGPAGLAAAQQINRAGHSVTVFERADYIGGLLRLGIPDFKLEKQVVQRRVDQMEAEGVTFQTGVEVGKTFPAEKLLNEYDGVVLTGGSTKPRDLQAPGRDLKGVHFAMEYLTQQNLINAGEKVPAKSRISAEGKRVIILGGGDTGSDCLGTAHRQGAEVVYQFEIMPEPPASRRPDNPWPQWPTILRSSSSHDEGGVRDYSILTKRFSGANGKLEKIHAVKVEWGAPDASGRPTMHEIDGSEFEMETDLVLLAMGFLYPEPDGMLAQLGVQLDRRGNVVTTADKMTSVPGIFAAGDMARGQSLVVWALAEGREAARGVDKYLMGKTSLRPVLSTR